MWYTDQICYMPTIQIIVKPHAILGRVHSKNHEVCTHMSQNVKIYQTVSKLGRDFCWVKKNKKIMQIKSQSCRLKDIKSQIHQLIFIYKCESFPKHFQSQKHFLKSNFARETSLFYLLVCCKFFILSSCNFNLFSSTL